MITLITGSLLLSVLHALIPSHWLPVLTIGRKENWTLAQVSRVTFLSGMAHALSTVIIGIAIALAGRTLALKLDDFVKFVVPGFLILMGAFFLYQNYRHKHFHLHKTEVSTSSIVVSLMLMMFLSPCLEIEAYFLLAASYGWRSVAIVSIIYTVVTVVGMLVWVRIAHFGMSKINSHAIEHNAGIITGVVLILTGVLAFFGL